MTLKLKIVLISTLLFNLSLLGCNKDKGPVGSKDNPMKMYFVPSDDTDGILTTAKVLTSYLEKYLSQKLYGKDEGFYIKSAIPNSYIAVVEAFGTNRADFAVFNTYGFYLLKEKKKYPGEAVVKILRGEKEGSYKAQIIARKDSNINSVKDLEGKKFAFTDPASTAGYIVPMAFIKEHGVNLGESVFAQRHDNVVTMVYQGQVDAGATYHSADKPDGSPADARVRVLTQYPDVLEKVKIVTFTGDIPNAPWVLRTNLYKDAEKYNLVKSSLQSALVEYANSPEGSKVLGELYGISGLVKSEDKDFDEIFKVFAASEKFIDKK